MCWLQTAELLRVHLNAHQATIDPADSRLGLPWSQALVDPEEQHRIQIDGICQEFIFSRVWPIMTMLQARLVANRVAWAMRLALSLSTPFLVSNRSTVSFPKHLDSAQILHWLLIDTWSLESGFEIDPGARDAKINFPLGRMGCL